ncbi:YbaB/EbfC family nucleoid-associated protein [Microtetraspora niveoalba]|uniref:YbaB/EbfC family nucleoid-associated protein n=1 Tax=Microtetraspora niveoalba TaxID=46175 RepID=UPI000833A020|nr:YbaB/EbfC family nucleoid-associated protein [Microtetraspora niveoalba]
MFDFDPAAVRTEEIDRISREAERTLRDLTEALGRLGEVTGEGEAAGGMIRAIVDGEGRIRDVRFDPRVMRQDSEGLAEAVVSAVRAAQEDARERTAEVLGPALEEPLGGAFADASGDGRESGGPGRPADRALDIDRARRRLEAIQDSFLDSMEGRTARLERFRHGSG